jgi:hypothetical protein
MFPRACLKRPRGQRTAPPAEADIASQGADHWMHVLATAVHELLDGARGSEPAARDNRLL